MVMSDSSQVRVLFEEAVVKVMLASVESLPFQVGVAKLSAFLRGNTAGWTVRDDIQRLPLFGLLAGYSKDQVASVIGHLIECGLYQIETVSRFKLPVVGVSDTGRLYLASTGHPPVGLLNAVLPEPLPELGPADYALFEQLRRVRARLADQEDMPTYVVCKDAVLFALAVHRPADADALAQVPGVTEGFRGKYADPFLAVLQSATPGTSPKDSTPRE